MNDIASQMQEPGSWLASARLWGRSLWAYWVVPTVAPPPAVQPEGFDVLRSEAVVIYRCQDCTRAVQPKIRGKDGAMVVPGVPAIHIGTVTLKTPPLGWIMARLEDPPEHVTRLLALHRARCHTEDA